MTAAQADHGTITRDDLESKLRELQGDVGATTETVKSYAVAVVAVVLVGIAAFAFVAGRRRGKAKSTIIEIRRI